MSAPPSPAACARPGHRARARPPRARLPHTGLAWSRYPQRADHAQPTATWRQQLAAWWPGHGRGAGASAEARLPAELKQAYARQQAALAGGADGTADSTAAAATLAAATADVRQALRREGATPCAAGAALAVVAHVVQRQLGHQPYATQLLAAWTLLQGRFAEMATGEGKTLAMGLAAAVAALAGTPVHVLTANDYLAARDEALLAPVYNALGLSHAAVVVHTPAGERSTRYRSAIVHSTAREIGFDYLRDHRQLGGMRDPRWHRARAMTMRGVAAPGAQGAAGAAPAAPQVLGTEPMLPGLCLALLDEADSLLLDEATVPLLLAEPGQPLDVAEMHAGWQLAQALRVDEHFHLQREAQRADLTAAGHAAVRAASPAAAPLRQRDELVQNALVAQHLLQRDRHYVVNRERGVELIDEATGRLASGRRWSGHLYPMVQIKEGLAPSAPTITAAQITYPRLFERYLALAGMSGTLNEARRELLARYGRPVERVPLAKPSRRRDLGARLFVDTAHCALAVRARVAELVRGARPVLVGAGSVSAAQRLASQLTASLAGQGTPAPQCLHALQDASEAALIARAGHAACVTVATNMAGRGTDIQLDEAARAAGGLHVIATMMNRSGRIDRQLAGRAARHGDPGSAEALLALDDPLLREHVPAWLRRLAAALARGAGGSGSPSGDVFRSPTGNPSRSPSGNPSLSPSGEVPGWLARPLLAWARGRSESADRARRRLVARAADESARWLGFAGAPE